MHRLLSFVVVSNRLFSGVKTFVVVGYRLLSRVIVFCRKLSFAVDANSKRTKPRSHTKANF